ncbi:alpha-ketoacid dehydrogenase subunit beta [Seohaeicola zhoushanensis]|uniref:Pyruvate dehydrogenase subunit beta n=1 Tax=Seohaeicola zhoushanensis TaxID=1569283 RepID=A0A8J3M7S5_9RHOB|nr:alpha-ketoacid dehydrogenase subunit beta [Seohaeicola zhoushanensis]GHF49489.1 pyruvate dehydrogenase subunit beta [Seohaeicola zhoushanensis]
MAVISYRKAINQALEQEMARDESVILMGIDVGGGTGGSGDVGSVGGVMGVTKGLYPKFGPDRVIDTPISESAIIGAAAGAAVTGMRPVAELMFVDFIGVCLDQIYNQAAKFRYMFGGKARTPLVIRTMGGAGMRAGAQHSQNLHPILTMIPGLKVVMPSNPYDAKGLLIKAIRDDDPVVFLESKALYDMKGEVPEEAYEIPFGEANILRDGRDATIVAFGAMVPRAMQAADRLAKDGVKVTVLDPRTTSPLDEEAILDSLDETGRLIVVDESPPRCSLAADVAALAVSQAFDALKAPVGMVTCPHTPVPFAPNLEDAYIPSVERIVEAVKNTL